MAIRARIKSKIKSLLFGTPKKEVVNPTPPAPQSFTAPTVSTTATSSVTQGSAVQQPQSDDAPADLTSKTTQSSEKSVVENTETPETPNATVEEPAEIDTENATFIIEVTELFPEVCPHCEASSHNNWIRIENKFACGSCETAY